MGKHKSKKEWIKLFRKYESDEWNWEEYFKNWVTFATWESKARLHKNRTLKSKQRMAKYNFRKKYKNWKLLDNMFMAKKKETRGRKKNKDKNDKLKGLNEKQIRELAKLNIEEILKKPTKERKAIANLFDWQISLKARIFNLDRSNFYKKLGVKKPLRWDWIKPKVVKIFYENKQIYGSGRITAILKKRGINIDERTLRRYMVRWDLIKRKKRESKNINVKYGDLVRRNFNPKEDNIIATDVTYIHANTSNGFVYLSVGISHNTKLIESWYLSEDNDNNLVINTIEKLKRTDLTILHSDHGTQYSSYEVIKVAKQHNLITSMGRVGNSLDNREVEYFFGCLKGEFLNHINTSKMSFNELKAKIAWYINWYNTKRIQKRLQWLAPSQVSQYAI